MVLHSLIPHPKSKARREQNPWAQYIDLTYYVDALWNINLRSSICSPNIIKEESMSMLDLIMEVMVILSLSCCDTLAIQRAEKPKATHAIMRNGQLAFPILIFVESEWPLKK